MKRSLATTWLWLWAVLLCGAASGPEAGLRAYKDHDFAVAIDACKGNKDVMSRLVLGLSYSERYGIYRNKQDRTDASMYLKILAVDVTMADVLTIERFLAIEGNPYGNKEAAGLLKKALETVRTPEHVLTVSLFLAPGKGADVNNMALAAIYKRLKPLRDYIGKGGSMPEADRELCANGTLINRLAGCLKERKTASYARKCLTMIEEPALKYLEDGRELGKYEADTIVDVKKAVAARVKKYPESTWFSAYGK